MNDDLRILVEHHLPRLAYQIMSPVSRMPNSAFPKGRHNFVRSADWDDLDVRGRLYYAGPTTIEGENAYLYRGRWPKDEGTGLMDQWYIAFYGINLVDVEGEEFEPLQVSQGEVRTIEVVSETNNTSSFHKVKSDTSTATTKSTENTFSATAETEFETKLTRSAEATVGVATGKSEFMARFKSRLELHTDNRWEKSDSITDKVEKEYTILPFSKLEVTIREGNPTLRQKIPTRGVLDCKTRIDIFNANSQDFDYLDDVAKCWAGLLPGRPAYTDWFGSGNAVPQAQVDEWARPHLDLDIEIRADRVRYSGAIRNEMPIAGKEAEFRKAQKEYTERVSL